MSVLVFGSHARLEQELEAGLGGNGLLETGLGGGIEVAAAQTAGGHGNGVSGARVVLRGVCADVVRRSRGAGALAYALTWRGADGV